MGSFAIDTYGRHYLEGMIDLYNRQTSFAPHIAPLTAELFIELVEGKSCFDPAGLFVAHDGGRVIGWIHACVAAGSEPHHEPGDLRHRIRMLLYEPQELKAGKALVHEATAWLSGRGATSIEAMHAKWGYPLYRGLWAGGEPLCPAELAHVHLALEVGGYRNTQESIFMTARMSTPPDQPRCGIDIELVDRPAAMAHEPMRQSWIGFEPMYTQAMAGGEVAGTIGWVVLPHVTRLGAPALNIWTLGVRDLFRRKGVAGALIARAMRLGYERGARHCSVGTQLWNAPAHASYARFGYTPASVLVGRSQELKPAQG